LRHLSLLSQLPESRLEIGTLVMYVVLIVSFLLLGVGLLYKKRFSWSLMIFWSSIVVIVAIVLFVLGIFVGGVLPAAEFLVGALLQPTNARLMGVEVLYAVLPLIVLCNPFHLWLFAKNSMLKSIFVPKQSDHPALHRKEL